MSTGRAQLRAGVKSILDGIKAANPTVLLHTYDHRPGSFRTPCAFVDNHIRSTNIVHDASTRMRDLIAEAHFVNKVLSNDQVADEQDVLSDLAEDAFTANPRATSSQTLTEHFDVNGHTETDEGGVSYACTVISIRGRFAEGRL